MYILFSRIGETKIEFSWCDMWENRICRAAGLCKYCTRMYILHRSIGRKEEENKCFTNSTCSRVHC